MNIYRCYIKYQGKYGEEELAEYFAERKNVEKWLDGWAKHFGFDNDKSYKENHEYQGWDVNDETDYVYCYLQTVIVSDLPKSA